MITRMNPSFWPLAATPILTGPGLAGHRVLLWRAPGVAWWVVNRAKDNAADYFLAGRNLSWWVIGASIFASNIGSEHIVGLAGSGAKDGVALAHYELHAWCLLVLAWVFVPFYARSLVFTMPEFLERRFSPFALRAVHRFADYLHCLEDCRRYFRRRRRFQCCCRRCMTCLGRISIAFGSVRCWWSF